MVDVSFISRAEHFIPLALLRYIADSSFSEPPSEIEYIKNKGIEAIKGRWYAIVSSYTSTE